MDLLRILLTKKDTKNKNYIQIKIWRNLIRKKNELNGLQNAVGYGYYSSVAISVAELGNNYSSFIRLLIGRIEPLININLDH